MADRKDTLMTDNTVDTLQLRDAKIRNLYFKELETASIPIHFTLESPGAYLRPFKDDFACVKKLPAIFAAIGHLRINHNTLFCPSKILNKHCFHFLLGLKTNWKQCLCKILEGQKRA